MALRLVFLGPPGTGKGTQAMRMEKRFGLKALSSGDTLRAEMAAGSEIGRKAEEYIKSGALVPDQVVTGVMLAVIGRLPAEAGFILDGFPRTVPQAEALDAGLAELEAAVDAVLYFQMEDRLIVERIASRRICSQDGKVYNLLFRPPRTAGRCDACGAELVQRDDDREDVVATRLDTYRRETAPLVAHYEARGLLMTIDASAPIDVVSETITTAIKGLGGGK